ncbi:DUF2786 domain-containing protein [Actinoallomurus sp. CA-150999]|uniref:DUF2786 domain-containing protein n=1 Tax=Actinoallomurus sp. CA-150999 TaxID=3239887 RepID=UPI003D8C8F11
MSRLVTDALTSGVTAGWRLGWQPADLVRHTVRTHGKRAGRMMTDAIAAAMRAYPAATVDDRWCGQLAALGAEVWWARDEAYLTAWADRHGTDEATATRCALQLITLLRGLPRLESLVPPPGEARRSTGGDQAGYRAAGQARDQTGDRATGRTGDQATSRTGDQATGRAGDRVAGRADRRALDRIRALLAKAESTEFPEEAEALTARAQQLMARHRIDQALLAARAGEVRADGQAAGPVGRRLPIDAPYESPKAALLGTVAEANRCRAVWTRALGFSTVLGFPADLDAVELLFTSLLVQADSALTYEGRSGGRSRTRAFRRSFLASYAARIGERLAEATGAAERRAAAEMPGTELLPVLATRDQAVDEAMHAMFPRITGRRITPGIDREGWLSGQAAADRADLGARRPIH